MIFDLYTRPASWCVVPPTASSGLPAGAKHGVGYAPRPLATSSGARAGASAHEAGELSRRCSLHLLQELILDIVLPLGHVLLRLRIGYHHAHIM